MSTPPSPGEPAGSLRDGIDPYEHLVDKPAASDRCPHCGGIGQIVADDELRYVCSLCGGPRFTALAPGVTAAEPAKALLRKVETARKWRASWTIAMITSGIGLAFMVMVIGVFAVVGALKASLIVAAIFGLPFAIALLLSISKRSGHHARIAPGIDAAWAALAAGAAHAGRAGSPAALAKALGVGEEQAEQLHTVLAVDAELGGAPPAGKVRIGGTEIEEPPRSQLAPDPRFDALEKRIAASVAPPATTPGAAPSATSTDPHAEEQAAEAEADATAAIASAKTVTADPPTDPPPR